MVIDRLKIVLISTNERFVEHGLRSISAYLKERGFETKMIFMPTSDRYGNLFYPEKILEDLYDLIGDCQIIGFTCMSACYDRTVQVIRFLKPKTKGFFVWGGIHATLFPESCINEVDAVAIGEGELALEELATRINNNQNYLNTENFWFNFDNKIIKNPVRPLLENLDLLPYPDYELETHQILNNGVFTPAIEFFKTNFWQLNSGRILVHSARGCPYNCTFCSNSTLNKLYKGKGSIIRKRSVNKLIGEIKYLLEKFPEAKKLFIDDDIFPVRPIEEIREFCKEYKKEIPIQFECYFTPKFIDDETFKLLIDAGLNHVLMGVQTGSERLNREIYKRYFTNKMVIDSSKIISKYKEKLKPTMYQLIISNPYEEEEDVIATIRLLQNIIPPFDTKIFNLVFFPGTELRTMVEKEKFYENVDEKSTTEYFDDLGHMKFEKKNLYLNSILRCMHGNATQIRIGLIPRFMINFLVNLNKSHFKFIGFSFLIPLIFLKDLKTKMYFNLMPLLPKSIQDFALRIARND
ncbi:MAG: radical SAM protein [Candidatus Methanoperedens sp.]|nr:radical SAM protein [Candidatus Methanoperedens sp.]